MILLFIFKYSKIYLFSKLLIFLKFFLNKLFLRILYIQSAFNVIINIVLRTIKMFTHLVDFSTKHNRYIIIIMYYLHSKIKTVLNVSCNAYNLRLLHEPFLFSPFQFR